MMAEKYEAKTIYEVKPGPASGFMTYATHCNGETKGVGLWAPDEERALALLTKAAEKAGWKRVAS